MPGGSTPNNSLPVPRVVHRFVVADHHCDCDVTDRTNWTAEQAHLEEENAALKLRLEGLRRAIHELEHQANTLREDARMR